jgi:hypothetical protein
MVTSEKQDLDSCNRLFWGFRAMPVAPLSHFSYDGCSLFLRCHRCLAGSSTRCLLVAIGLRRGAAHALAHSLVRFLAAVRILACGLLLSSPRRRNDLFALCGRDRTVSQESSG